MHKGAWRQRLAHQSFEAAGVPTNDAEPFGRKPF